jgi:hypothetical protein
MPPTDPAEPPKGEIVPNPNDILKLGDERWLTIQGHILTTEFGDPVELRPNTLAFWEAAALRGAVKPLRDLFEGLDQNADPRFRELDMLEWVQVDAEKLHASEPDNEQARHHLNHIKERIDRLKTELVIDLGRGGLDRID